MNMISSTQRIFSVILLAGAIIGTPLHAEKYEIEEKTFTVGTDLEVADVCQIKERTLHLTTTFEFTGKYPGSASKSMFSWGTEYKVYDENKELIATIKKNVFKSMFSAWSNSFIILDKNGKTLATSQKFSGIRPSFYITETNGANTYIRASGWRYYTWHVDTGDSSLLDPRIIWTICASKTEHDNKK